jgi:ribosomal protein S18 acetylase RimI-like enzyme
MKKSDFPRVVDRLMADPLRNAWAIQDLRRWPDTSRIWCSDPTGDALAYVLESGHPGTRGGGVVIVSGPPMLVKPLLAVGLPDDGYVIRETSAELLPVIEEVTPTATVYPQIRMDVRTASFIAHHNETDRKLSPEDAVAFAAFHGAPAAASGRFAGWLGGATLFGAFDGETLAAFGSTMVETPEVWIVVSISTRADYRGRGFGTRATSAITAAGLEAAECVSLTVAKDNAAAIRLYEKLGFTRREDRVWVDVGLGSAP